MQYEQVESAFDQLRERVRNALDGLAVPVARVLAYLRISPNQVSLIGFLLNLVAAWFVIRGDLVIAGAIYLGAGCMDLLDGTLARLNGQETKFGAFIDSTIDRVSEGVVFAAITYRFAVEGEVVFSALVVLALLGSILVSYVRARAEGLGGQCKVGLVTRAERVILLSAGLLLGWLPETIVLLVVLTGVTVIQRIHYVAKQFAPVTDGKQHGSSA